MTSCLKNSRTKDHIYCTGSLLDVPLMPEVYFPLKRPSFHLLGLYSPIYLDNGPLEQGYARCYEHNLCFARSIRLNSVRKS